VIARVGLTGGIGSGKSTVAAMFSELGVPLLDLDAVGRALLDTEADVGKKLARAFGETVLLPSGKVDRMELARIAFASFAATRRLNAIMHPLIRREEDRWVAGQNGGFCLIEASVLIESGGAPRMDAIVAVMTDSGQRRERVRRRGHPPMILFDRIVDRQCSDEERLAVADYIIANNGGLEQLGEETKNVYERLQARFPAA